ncbi:MAG: hypothetical protein ABSC42_18380 [Tepidisphaeraceae bacterium]|jgi:predicted nucleic acid-binding protein
MIVYVETNFLLEIARQQEEAPAANEILRRAEEGKLKLVLPAISIFEPFSTLTYYGLERSRFVDDMEERLKELRRLAPHKRLARDLEPLPKALLSLKYSEMNALEAVTTRALNIGELINITSPLFAKARAIEATLGLSPQDAIVFASVEDHVIRQPPNIPKCFASRNSKDFDDPSLIERLELANCRYIATFADALKFVENTIRSA